MKTFDIDQQEDRRDQTFRRRPDLRVISLEDALGFVDSSGIVFAFKSKKSELPCLWHAACGQRAPIMPRHTHHDPSIGLVWRAKDLLSVQKKIYYGKALKKIPTMISLELFPAFYSARGCTGEEGFAILSRNGLLSLSARRIYEVLRNSPPLTTKTLKMSSGHGSPSDRYTFDRAMAELQARLLIVKISEENDPFTFIWGRLDRWLVEEVALAQGISEDDGHHQVLARYFRTVVAATPHHVEKLFRWKEESIQKNLERLQDEEIITGDVSVKDQPGTWYLHTDFR